MNPTLRNVLILVSFVLGAIATRLPEAIGGTWGDIVGLAVGGLVAGLAAIGIPGAATPAKP